MKNITLFTFGILLTLTFNLVWSNTTPNPELKDDDLLPKSDEGDETMEEEENDPNADNEETSGKNNGIESCKIIRSLTEVNDDKENTERTVKCTCRTGKVAGTRREQPACVPQRIFDESKWCDMEPCLEHESCKEMENGKGWRCSDATKTKEVVIHSDANKEINDGSTEAPIMSEKEE